MQLDSKKAKPLLYLSFTFIVTLTILSNVISFEHLSNVQNNINQIIETQNIQIAYMHTMRSIARERIIKLQEITNEEDPFEQDSIISEYHEMGGHFLETRELLLKTELMEDEQILLNLQRETSRNIVSSQKKVIELAQKGLRKEASDYLRTYTIPAQNENLSLMDQFILYQNHQNLFLKSDAYTKTQSASHTVFLLTISTVVLTLIIAYFVIKNITTMLNLLHNSIKKHEQSEIKLSEARSALETTVDQRTKELQKANTKLQHQADHDPLTKLPNRRLYYELLSHEIAKAERNKYKLAILYMDLDGFKAINDALGHAMGDLLLVNITKRLNNSLRKEDLIARLGGDEFTICYTNIKQIEDVVLLCKILINKISQPMFLDQHQCNIGISIGVSIYPEHGTDYDTLMRVADSHMYHVKKHGKNNFSLGEQMTVESE
ncbi:MAG: diguanylate cyclase [Gammaproteobacteria bacterium]|nr:diguanylate cyclase [Gammaproteobacteria bacterium]